MKQGCRYPNCPHVAVATWAQVPLCIDHYIKIASETLTYYEKAIEYKDRVHYLAIADLIPWKYKEGIR